MSGEMSGQFDVGGPLAGEIGKGSDPMVLPHELVSSLQADQSGFDLTGDEATLKALADVFSQNAPLSPHSLTAPSESSYSFSEEVRYRSLVDQLPAVVFMASLDKGIGDAYVSPQIEAALGFSQSEWLQDPIRWYQHIHPDDKTRWSTEAAEMMISGTPLKSAYRVISRDGRVVWFQCEAKMLRGEDGRPWAIHGVGFDITELKESEKALKEKHKQLQLLKDVATKANQATNVTEAMQFAVERVCEFTGWPLGHVCFTSRDRKQLLSSNIWSSIPGGRFQTFREVSETHGNSPGADLTAQVFENARPAWIRDVASDPNFSRQSAAQQVGIKSAFAFPVLSGIGVVAVLEFFSDLCSNPDDVVVDLMAHVGAQIGQAMERVRAQEKLLHDAFHDPLTALPNRAFFLERLERSQVLAKRHADYKFAVLFLDIDRFKIVNDSLGHSAGDELIIQASQRISQSLRREDIVSRPVIIPISEWDTNDDILARLGGDEFTVLLEDIRDPSGAVRAAERIQNAFAEPFVICGQEIFASASIGIAGSSPQGTAADLLRDADTAMYRAKLHGKGRYEVFDQAMHEHSVRRLKLETDLRRAVERKEFRVFYQPIVSLQTGTIAGFEALVRWQRPGVGVVGPEEFIAATEEMGLIVPIGEWIFRTSCEQARRWHVEHPQELMLTMSVNISGRQFAQSDLVAKLEKILRETEVETTAINLEITESVTMGDPETAIKVIKELKKFGLRISIDDFGTGYSSLSYLRRFPIDTLKIDRSFVRDLANNSENREIVRTIIGLARNLGMDVVAEGTEMLEEVKFLKNLNCEFAQGYYFSRPVGNEQARALLSENRVFDLPSIENNA